MDDIRRELIDIYNKYPYNYHNNMAYRILVDALNHREELPDFLTYAKSRTYSNLSALTAKRAGRTSRFFKSLKIRVLQVVKRLNSEIIGKFFPIFILVLVKYCVIGYI